MADITLDSLGSAAEVARRNREAPGTSEAARQLANLFAQGGNAFFRPEEFDPGPSTQVALGMIGAPAAAGGVPLGALGSGVGKGIRAYHGSPHDFERFDLSKIGTGEGAQAYGHGLYFAENPQVARMYRENLGGKTLRVGGDQTIPADQAIDLLVPDIKRAVPNFATPTQAATWVTRAISEGKTPEQIQRAISGMAWTAEQKAAATAAADAAKDWKSGGRMYEVNINAQPEQFLDWDKPLAQMTPEIQKRLADAWLAHPEAHARQTGAQIYGNTALDKWNLQPSPGPRPEATLASDALRDLGIPGIKYLDQGSRVVPGQVSINRKIINDPNVSQTMRDQARADLAKWESENQTSNYVLFRDDIIDILRKYGLAGAAVPAAAKSLSDMSQE